MSLSFSQNVAAWPTKTDDFFPYANRNNSYWTGFFSSRPTLKYMERYTNALLQISKQVREHGSDKSPDWGTVGYFN